MHVRDWKLFIEGKWDNEIAVAQLSQDMTDYLGASSRRVHLHQDYALKAVKKHGLTLAHLPLIFEVVDYGMALTEIARPLSLTFLYFDRSMAGAEDWYQVSVKRGFEDRRLFLTTFHRSNPGEVARKVRLHAVVRDALK